MSGTTLQPDQEGSDCITTPVAWAVCAADDPEDVTAVLIKKPEVLIGRLRPLVFAD